MESKKQNINKSFYDSTLWKKARHKKLYNDPYCNSCGKIATEVDHIISIKERPDLRLTSSNFASKCKSCHSRKTHVKSRGENPFW